MTQADILILAALRFLSFRRVAWLYQGDIVASELDCRIIARVASP